MSLNEIEEGSECRLISLNEKGLGPHFANDLLDYGLLPGVNILLVKKFRDMDKIILRVGEGEIAIRNSDAKFIEVKIA
jgi:ferrous iron transport protein A